jgi:hypothetical protein
MRAKEREAMFKIFVFSVLALTSSRLYGQDPCAARLVPNVDASKLDEVTKYSFLQLINNGNYEQAQKVIEASGDATLVGLIKMGNATLDYKAFDVKRREFLSAKSMKEEVGQASLRYYVPKKARTQYFDCITSRPGLIVAFSDEDNSHATARVRYNGAPGGTVEFEVVVTDGTVRQSGVEKTKSKLTDGKTFKFDVERSGGHVIQVNAYSQSSSMSGSAVSAPPPERR